MTAVTVVIPVRNGARFLGEQLEALAKQDFDQPWDLVVADNGSTDDTLAIAESYRDRFSSLTIVDASAERGVSYARTIGMQHAAAPVIAYCDADDVAEPDWLRELYACWTPGSFVAGGIEHDLLNDPSHGYARGKAQMTDLPVLMDLLPVAAACNLLIERSVLETVGGWRFDLIHSQDVELCWRLQLAGHPLVFAEKAIVHYRLRRDKRSVYRQVYGYNFRYPMLYKEYRVHGARRRTAAQVVARYLWVVTRLPYLVMDTRRKHLWYAVAGEVAGRFAGSRHYRVLFL